MQPVREGLLVPRGQREQPGQQAALVQRVQKVRLEPKVLQALKAAPDPSVLLEQLVQPEPLVPPAVPGLVELQALREPREAPALQVLKERQEARGQQELLEPLERLVLRVLRAS